jgi:hypothetical protein
MNTNLVFGIKMLYFCNVNRLAMSQELKEFSELIDEQFEISIILDDNFWDYVVSFFKAN